MQAAHVTVNASRPASLPASPREADAYILGPGDQLQISFLAPAFASLGGSFTLLNDGSTNLPQLGSVVLEGLTIGQAEAWLRQLYARSMRRPDLTLRVTQPRPMQVSVVGEVANPGIYLLSPGGEASSVEGGSGGSIPGLPTLVSAIQKAGGITLNANLGDIRLQRRLPGDSSQLKETSLSLLALLQKGDKRQNPFLFDGDTIVVGRAAAPASDEVLEIAAANLSPQQIQVNIVGEVKSPGRIGLRAGTPLIPASMIAGGPVTDRTDRGHIELSR
ncbi:MAG: polysaccharide biosynthesis/export family protein, partial [Prochlorococcaceae cyanobacterium]